eukprot:m51a1_g14094 putative histone chaperone asf1b (178) ;mRNA; r:71491-72109
MIAVSQVQVLNNPAPFTAPLQFEITFDCYKALPDDLEWKLIYVGSAQDETKDQVLDTVLLGPLQVGTSRFVFQADAPSAELIPREDLLGVTVILLTCSYRAQEYMRFGWYVSNEYDSDELREAPPQTPDLGRIRRDILATSPRVTTFPIAWDDAPAADQQQAQEQPKQEPKHEAMDL